MQTVSDNFFFFYYSQTSIQRGARLLKIELVISKTNVLGMEEKEFFRN